MSWFKKPAPKPQAQMAVVANPATVNPTEAQNLSFAGWRAAHIDRFLAQHPEMALSDPKKVEYLMAERDMYRAMLRMQ